jgi:hypothetical protein
VSSTSWGTLHPRRRHATGGAAEYVVVPADRVGSRPSRRLGYVTALARDRHAGEAAGTIAFLASDDSGFIAAAALRLGGGITEAFTVPE